MNPHHDDWLDAFELAELADPELAAIDAAADRVLEKATRAPRRRRWWAPLGVAAAVLLGVVWWTLPDTEPPTTPIPGPRIVSDLPPRPVTSQPEPAPVREVPPQPPRGVVTTSHPREGRPARAPGLLPTADARVEIAHGRATLHDGTLTYLHDQRHDPGVSVVALGRLPVELHPVGTAFTVVALGDVGAVRVREGTVRVRANTETVLTLDAGQEALFLSDPDTPGGVWTRESSLDTLDQLLWLVPGTCACRPQDAIAAVAQLRFSSLRREEGP